MKLQVLWVTSSATWCLVEDLAEVFQGSWECDLVLLLFFSNSLPVNFSANVLNYERKQMDLVEKNFFSLHLLLFSCLPILLMMRWFLCEAFSFFLVVVSLVVFFWKGGDESFLLFQGNLSNDVFTVLQLQIFIFDCIFPPVHYLNIFLF